MALEVMQLSEDWDLKDEKELNEKNDKGKRGRVF